MKIVHKKEERVEKPYLLNISNHPSSGWTGKQLATARRDYREIIDFPFPNVDPEFDEEEVHQLAEFTVSEILDTLAERPGFDLENESLVAHVMGEMSLLFQMVNLLETYNITCVCSTSKRISEELENGQKLVKFEFVRFRPYLSEFERAAYDDGMDNYDPELVQQFIEQLSPGLMGLLGMQQEMEEGETEEEQTPKPKKPKKKK